MGGNHMPFCKPLCCLRVTAQASLYFEYKETQTALFRLYGYTFKRTIFSKLEEQNNRFCLPTTKDTNLQPHFKRWQTSLCLTPLQQYEFKDVQLHYISIWVFVYRVSQKKQYTFEMATE